MQISNDIVEQAREAVYIPNIHVPRRPVIEAYDRYLNDLAVEMDRREKNQRR